ncbi:hypothetical protein FNW02_17890 [Komarekiella sp. 'clone 1']|uniref:Uncharacterized protein n=1 Tax=Komarekiella delphini-convector SJRDD-AB1 TaxID=2593771 RepID=A0AA40SZ36_9NOST|nr:hypothetical protein [Komarekiella delphini-convector]MBD6617647.1 hypothetical protein [Komarekiella delphini-convector SJRDD-AB1]
MYNRINRHPICLIGVLKSGSSSTNRIITTLIWVWAIAKGDIRCYTQTFTIKRIAFKENKSYMVVAIAF